MVKLLVGGLKMPDGNTGIGGGDGTLPSDRTVKYATIHVHAQQVDFLRSNNELFQGHTQNVSAQITGDLYIYREPNTADGNEVYLVSFVGGDIISPCGDDGHILSDIVLTGGSDRNGLSSDLAKGFFHYRSDVKVQPADTRHPISWVLSAPQTPNKSHTVTDQVVMSYTTNEGVESDGEDFKVSMGASQTSQNWHSITDTFDDWSVVETSNAGENSASWTYAQYTPWDGRNDGANNFNNWWQDAYNVGGGWDDVKNPNDLSKETMQYHYIAAWRFFRPISDAPFAVEITGTSTHYYCLIVMPQCQPVIQRVMNMAIRKPGNHTFYPAQSILRWSQIIDLKAATNFKT